jgi:hypothetical protein
MSTLRGISRRDLERLSSYIDGELPERELARLEARFKIEPELNRAMHGLRQAVELVRGLPEQEPPRQFTLTPEMIEPRASRFSVLPFSTALAAIIFVAVVGVDVLSASVGERMLAPVSEFEFQRQVEMLATQELEPGTFADTEGEALGPASEDAMLEQVPAEASVAEEAASDEVPAAELQAAEPEAELPASAPEEPEPLAEAAPVGEAGQEVDRAAEPGLISPADQAEVPDSDDALKFEQGELRDESVIAVESQPARSARTNIFRITEIILGAAVLLLGFFTFRRARRR